MIFANQVIALVLAAAAAAAAVELEKLLLPPAGKPRIYTYYRLPNVAIWLFSCFLLGFAMNLLELNGRIRGIAVLEFMAVLYLYGKFRKTR